VTRTLDLSFSQIGGAAAAPISKQLSDCRYSLVSAALLSKYGDEGVLRLPNEPYTEENYKKLNNVFNTQNNRMMIEVLEVHGHDREGIYGALKDAVVSFHGSCASGPGWLLFINKS
jgi:hypothetical protein